MRLFWIIFDYTELQKANNFKSWKMRKKLKADFGKCFEHEWLVFVVHFENSLTPQ